MDLFKQETHISRDLILKQSFTCNHSYSSFYGKKMKEESKLFLALNYYRRL